MFSKTRISDIANSSQNWVETKIYEVCLLVLQTWNLARFLAAPTLRDRGSLLFLLGERREEPLPATARFFDLAAVHGQGRINFKKPAFNKFKTGFEFAHGRRESKRWLKTLTRTWKCTRSIMQISYLYASNFPFKNSHKLSQHATLHKWCGRNCCLLLNLRCKSNSIGNSQDIRFCWSFRRHIRRRNRSCRHTKVFFFSEVVASCSREIRGNDV